MKKLLFFLLFTCMAFGQEKYSYAVIASKFGAQKSPGQYGLNDLARQFMMKYGYATFLDSDILPQDAATCKALYMDVLPDNTMLKTRLKVVLKNCRNEIIASAEGESKEKEYRVSYNQAMRDAFQALSEKGFPAASTNESDAPALKKAGEPVTASAAYLSVQPIAEGFQIVDTTPKVVLKIYRTSSPDLYIAEDSRYHGVFLRRNNKWHFEYYDAGQFVSEPFEVTLQ